MENKTENKNPIQVTDRLFLVIETLAETGPLTLAALCQRLDLNKSTVHRLLSSLIYVGYVRQDPSDGRYALSFRFLTLSNQILQNIDILEIARPFIRELSRETGETVHFVQLDGLEAVYIYKQESSQNSIRMASKVGSRIPLYCSGIGKAMLADMEDEAIKKIWDSSSISKLTPHTITDYTAFFERIQEVRQRGYALDDEENEIGVRCIAAAVQGFDDGARYAFSISAPVTRMDDARIAALSQYVLRVKKEIQTSLR